MRIAVFYATREGHTRKIAEHVASDLRLHGLAVDLFNLKDASPVDWTRYATACIAASVHAGHHEPEVIAFAKRHRDTLALIGTVFMSVTLSEAGAEDHTQPFERRQAAAADAHRMVEVFVEETGWRPAQSLCVAGALAYSHYNVFIKWIMKRIARKAGAPTDASRDYEFTDWAVVDEFVGELVRKAETTARPHI